MSYIEIDNDVESTQKDFELSKRIGEKLHKDFPGYLWAVKADCKQGMCSVLNMSLDGEWGFYIRINEIQDDPSLKKIRQYGGELLERFRVSRKKFNPDEVQSVERDFRNRLVVDAI